MEIINAKQSILTNFEVKLLLQEMKGNKRKCGPRSLATIIYETLQYLNEAPCKGQTRESIVNFVTEMRKFKLKPQELLMMVNEPATHALHIQLFVDDNKSPLSEEDVEAILSITRKHFFNTTTPDSIS